MDSQAARQAHATRTHKRMPTTNRDDRFNAELNPTPPLSARAKID
jgi:hypothetical protein